MRIPHGTRTGAAALGLVLLSASAGCGALGGGPVELTFWAWAPNIEKVVQMWNEDHPDVQVTVTELGAGEEAITKFLTASDAGNPPDLIQAEYQALTTLVSNDTVADISEYVGDLEGEFSDGVWQQVTLNTGTVYAVPQDTAPMMLYYRHDLFDEFGLEVPATWEEFADVARQVREDHPDHYLTTFSSADPGWFAGLAQQAGASWWSIEGDAWRVSVDDDATTRVAEYWGELVAEGAVDDQPMYTPAWNTALNDGTLLAWPSAVWAPGVLEGNAAETAGKWSMAPLPQWEEGAGATGHWGGSSTAVAAGSDQIEAAAEFAAWLNTDPEAVNGLVRESALYPASSQGQTGSALAEPPEFFAHQEDFYEQVQQIAQGARGFTWGPNVNVTYSTYSDAFGAAIKDDGSFTDAVAKMQETTRSDMRDQGFSLVQ